MKTRVEVEDREEAVQIQTALEDAEVRAFVRVVGILLGLPSERAQKRVLSYVADSLAEEAGG